MRLLRAIAKDFLTYEELDYTFLNRPLLVQGLNLSDDNQQTNGVGKTGLQTVIEHCITGSNSRGVRDAELVTYGKDMATIELYAECDVRKERLHIEWDIKVKGSNVIRLSTQKYDSEKWEPVKFSNVDDGKKYIGDWFAISKEDLFNYYIINKKRFTSFFKSSNTEKVALINRFSDASLVDGIDNIDTEKLNEDYTKAKSEFDEIVGKINFANEQITKEQARDFVTEKNDLEKQINTDIEDIEEEITSLEESIPTIRANKSGFEKSIEEQNDLKAVLDTEKLGVDKLVKETKECLKTTNIELTKAKDLVDKFVITNWEEKRSSHKTSVKTLNTEAEKIKEEKSATEKQEKQALEILKGIENSLSGIITCPSCQHEFLLGDGESVEVLREKETKVNGLKTIIQKTLKAKDILLEETKKKISEIELKLSEINKNEQTENTSKNELTTSLNSITKKVNEIEQQLAKHEQKYVEIANREANRLLKITSLNNDIANIEVKVTVVNTEIASYRREIETLETSKTNLKIDSNKAQIKTLKDQLKVLEEDKIKATDKHSKIGDEIYVLNQWSKNFKNFRMVLANQSLEVIEYNCNRYLTEMKSDLLVRMEGYKVLSNGSVKEEINAIIIRNAVERTFSSYSAGEGSRLMFASILTNKFLIDSSHPYGGLDFLMIDEILEGCDSAGIMSILDSAKLLQIPVLLITHISVEKNDDIITIIKENGKSRIE